MSLSLSVRHISVVYLCPVCLLKAFPLYVYVSVRRGLETWCNSTICLCSSYAFISVYPCIYGWITQLPRVFVSYYLGRFFAMAKSGYMSVRLFEVPQWDYSHDSGRSIRESILHENVPSKPTRYTYFHSYILNLKEIWLNLIFKCHSNTYRNSNQTLFNHYYNLPKQNTHQQTSLTNRKSTKK